MQAPKDEGLQWSTGAHAPPGVPLTGLRAAAVGERPRPLPLNLLTDATRLWGAYRRGEIGYTALEGRLLALEASYGFEDRLCEECAAPAQVTDRGVLCDEHYQDDRPPCEICGLRAAAALHNGYLQCGVCINTGASYA